MLPQLLTIGVLLGLAHAAVDTQAPRRHDYKLSFKRPYYVNGTIPFFTLHGNVIPAYDYIRLAPSARATSGAIWAQESNPHEQWQVDLTFNIFGRDKYGSRGIAFWYAKDRAQSGEVFGSRDNWDGLLIAFDTFSDQSKRVNPYVYAVLNDGSMTFQTEPNRESKVVDGCFRPFRNTHTPVHARIAYVNEEISVAVDVDGNGKKFLDCFRIPGIRLPTGYYFGVSAATGQFEDDHDVFSMDTWMIRPGVDVAGATAEASPVEHLSSAERARIAKAEKQVRDQRQQHHAQPVHTSEADVSGEVSKLREAQFRILESLEDLHKKLVDTSSKKVVEELHMKHDTTAEELQTSINELAETIHAVTGPHGLAAEIKQLKAAVQQLSSKLSQAHDQTMDMHAQVHESIQETRAETQTSMFRYIALFVGLQVVLYIVWSIYRLSQDNAPKKFI